jgi:hypothetical protein
MIRFRCPHCGQALKVWEKRAGTAIPCPRCQGPALPGAAAPARAGRSKEPGVGSRAAAGPGDQPPGVFAGMSRGLRRAVAVVAGVGAASLVLAVVAPLLPAPPRGSDAVIGWAQFLVPASVILLLVMLYGHGTGCPACGRWWARRKVETAFVDREVFAKGGVPFARATYRTIYQCDSCRHRWSVSFTDEYKEFIRDHPKQPLGCAGAAELPDANNRLRRLRRG